VNIKERRISQSPLFAECTRDQVKWIAGVADELHIPAGRTFVRPGQAQRDFIVILDGTAAARNGGGEVVYGPGSYFGEGSILPGRHYHRTIEARSDLRLLVFEVRAFRALVDHVPSVDSVLVKEFASDAPEEAHEASSLRAVS
jgi:CRP-like cAMP-binding protein